MTTYKDLTRQEVCARCGVLATRWSGVEDWRDELGRWIGWCSNVCKNAWLNGDKATEPQPAEGGADA